MIKVEFKHITRTGIEGFLVGYMIRLRNGNYDVVVDVENEIMQDRDPMYIGNIVMDNISPGLMQLLFDKELIWEAPEQKTLEEIYNKIFG